MQRDCTALIPAAGPVPLGMLASSTLTSPAMIPVAGRPVVHWTIDYLLSLGITKFRIAVPKRGLFVESYVDSVFGAEAAIEFMVPSEDLGPGFTVCELAKGVETVQTLVVLGDTFFRFADPEVMDDAGAFVLTSEVAETYRWCIAERDSSGHIAALHDKVPDLADHRHALIGAYAFPTSVLQKAADRVAKTLTTRGQRPAPDGVASGEVVSISNLLKEIRHDIPIKMVEAGRWIDCGNPDRQVDAQRMLLAERAFNEITVDAVYGTLTKQSHHVVKFIDEINYLRLLPSEIAVLFPRLLDYDLDPERPSMTMEFYGYPTLSELFVFQSLDPAVWRQIFTKLARILHEGFGAFKRDVTPADSREMLLGKVLRRRDEMELTPALRRVLVDKEPLEVNGTPLRTLAALLDTLELEVEQLTSQAQGSIIHGDLCFSNILFDPRSGIFKFVDPRGSYGSSGIYGDLRYDVAKLCHSVVGEYDFITADLFRASVAGDAATLAIRSRPEHAAIRGAFEDVFFADYPRRSILLMTGLVFLGLPALHFDAPDRQLAFAIRGTQMVNEALSITT